MEANYIAKDISGYIRRNRKQSIIYVCTPEMLDKSVKNNTSHFEAVEDSMAHTDNLAKVWSLPLAGISTVGRVLQENCRRYQYI